MVFPFARFHSLFAAALVALWLAPGPVHARQGESEPAPGAAPSGVSFRGLRMGMSPAETEAAGFRLGAVRGHPSGAIGYVLRPLQPQGIRHMAAYYIHERLFELAVSFDALSEPAARALTESLYAALDPPPGAGDGLRVAARWISGHVVVRYSIQAHGDGLYAPDLLLQDEAGYLEARVYFSQIEYSH